jgi:tetratricopeptide (TPR) repeat protein
MRKTQIIREYPVLYYFLLLKEYCKEGTLLADVGYLKEALENFNKAVEVDPANPIAYFNLTTIKMDMGDIEEREMIFSILID